MRVTVAFIAIASCTLFHGAAGADEGQGKPPAAPAATSGHERAAAETDAILEIRSEWTKTRAADAPPLETADDRGREQIGRLVHSKVTLEFDEVTVREALRALRRELGLNMTVFTRDPSGRSERPGFDGEQRVSLALSEVDGRAALESIIAFADKDVTWQLHNGVIEVGPRAHLARDEARETRVYETADLALDPPDYEAPAAPGGAGRAIQRRNSDEVIGELVKMIVLHCEPQAFEPPPPVRLEEETGSIVPTQHTTPSGNGGGRGGTGRKSPNTGATANFDPAEAQVFVQGRWASISAKDNNLAVLAPDFVHRAIGGYPTPIPPPRRAE